MCKINNLKTKKNGKRNDYINIYLNLYLLLYINNNSEYTLTINHSTLVRILFSHSYICIFNKIMLIIST